MWRTPDYINAAIAVMSALIALIALLSSRRANRENLRLNTLLANRPGNLHSLRIDRTGRQRGYSELVLVNGPTDVTVVHVWLEVAFYYPGRFFERTYKVQIWVNDEYDDDFSIFGIDGPELPLRLAANDEAIWKTKVRKRAAKPSWVELKLGAMTTNREPVHSEVQWFGSKVPSLWGDNFHSYSGSISSYIADLPIEVQNWIRNCGPNRSSTTTDIEPGRPSSAPRNTSVATHATGDDARMGATDE